ncbi:MAG: ribosomal RNA small subunit methyltransferase A [Dehalococcoidia bacterium]|nr:ribosomal RNA small subunit methyltransferase A [Dehalococcoidia bacterium]
MARKGNTLHNNKSRRLPGTGLKAKRRLGQNFLVDATIRDAVLDGARVLPGDTVVEVGPGLGVLTEKLVAQAKRVVAVELDEDLVGRLTRKLGKSDNLKIVHADILKLDLKKVLEPNTSYKVVANIPYYITSPILRYFTQNEARPSLMVIMMQAEVAEDIAAKPGHMTFLAVSMQLFSRPEIICKVPAASFSPVPKVDSAVVRFNMLDAPAVPADEIDGFLQLVHAGFSAPRKQMRNSLALGLKLGLQSTAGLLEAAGIDPQRRPGNLTLEEWWKLYLNRGMYSC